MKKNLLVIALASASVLAFYSCSNEETTPPTVTISSPSEGSNLNVYAPFTVKAEGEAGSGEISKVISNTKFLQKRSLWVLIPLR